MTYYFPEELVLAILCRLPSKSLLRCMSVCKSWYSLISSNAFKLTHLKMFNPSNPHNLVRRFDMLAQRDFYSLHFDDEALTMVPHTLVEFSFRYCNICTRNFSRMIGCVNGVVCLFHGNCLSREDKIILWNPSIRKQLTITPAMFNSSHAQYLCLIYGFGYDKTSDDFKVVRLAYDSHDHRSFSSPDVVVYSVKNDNSRVVQFSHDLPWYPLCSDSWSQVFFNGCVHWIVRDFAISGSNSTIMTFDMSTERFGRIELPIYLAKKPAYFIKATVVVGCLAVVYARRPRFAFAAPSEYAISIMREYKNTTSWRLVYRYQYPGDVGRILHLRDDGGVLLGCDYGALKVYDSYPGYWFDSQFVPEESIYIGGYQESLALLNEGHAYRDEAHDE